MRILVAMSGGVDSSVAAGLLREQGHEVIGATLKLWQGPEGEAPTAGCCTVSDSEDARRVAAQLDIPYYVLDYTDHFRRGVIDRFMDDYRVGRTPNPCIECNRSVKFSKLLEQAAAFGCDLLATGHYAQVLNAEGHYRLIRGKDRRKDQSYVLSMLTQAELAKVTVPVGALDKEETRAIATSLGLRTAGKRDSQDICFVGKGSYREFLRIHDPATMTQGPIVDSNGDRIGTHEGVGGFTVGQRRGVGVAIGERQYVLEVRADTATIVLGVRARLEVNEILLENLTWVRDPLSFSDQILVQYRAHGEAVSARWGDGRLWFTQPQFAVAPGQTAALYMEDEVIGSGIIVRAA
jgi:tRNA-specific 2-thiouridylase